MRQLALVCVALDVLGECMSARMDPLLIVAYRVDNCFIYEENTGDAPKLSVWSPKSGVRLDIKTNQKAAQLCVNYRNPLAQLNHFTGTPATRSPIPARFAERCLKAVPTQMRTMRTIVASFSSRKHPSMALTILNGAMTSLSSPDRSTIGLQPIASAL